MLLTVTYIIVCFSPWMEQTLTLALALALALALITHAVFPFLYLLFFSLLLFSN